MLMFTVNDISYQHFLKITKQTFTIELTKKNNDEHLNTNLFDWLMWDRTENIYSN